MPSDDGKKSSKLLALERFLRRERKQLTAFALTQMGPRLLAAFSEEDMFGDTCTRALEAIDQFESDLGDLAALRAWVGTIMCRVIAYTARKIDDGLEELKSDVLNAASNDELAPIKQAGDSETLTSLHEAIKKLPPKWQSAVNMHYFQDIKVPAIAEQLEVTQDVVHYWLRSAHARIKELMGSSSDHYLPGLKWPPKPPEDTDGSS